MAEPLLSRIRCFRRLRGNPKTERRGIWVYDADRSDADYKGLFFHGSREEIQPPRFSPSELEPFWGSLVDEITAQQALDELGDWEAGKNALRRMAERFPLIIGDHPPDDEPNVEWECQCARCGSSVDWLECEHCDEGFDGHDCGEDCCICLYPEENMVCDICRGEAGWRQCMSSADYCNANPLPEREHIRRGKFEWYPCRI